MQLNPKALFNKDGDTDLASRKDGDTDLASRQIINGNTTNLNDFNNVKYGWTSQWYRQAMNNFWIPEEINLSQDIKDYRNLTVDERTAYDKILSFILSFLVFLDSLQTANLPNIGAYITANEVNLCLTIQAFQEAVHSQSYSYMLDTICSPEKRNEILYQWKDDEHLLHRNEFIGNLYNDFLEHRGAKQLVKTLIANYILEGIYFYSGFMFFYNLGRMGKMPGSAQEIRYINRDENTHLWLFRNIILDLKKECPELFTPEDEAEYREMLKTGAEQEMAWAAYVTHLWLFRNIILDLKKECPELFTPEDEAEYREMLKTGAEQEMAWAAYVIGDRIEGLNLDRVQDYIRYLANLRARGLGLEAIYEGCDEIPESMAWVDTYSRANDIKTDFEAIYEGCDEIPESMAWVDTYSRANDIKTDFFEAKSTAYTKAGAIVDDL